MPMPGGTDIMYLLFLGRKFLVLNVNLYSAGSLKMIFFPIVTVRPYVSTVVSSSTVARYSYGLETVSPSSSESNS